MAFPVRENGNEVRLVDTHLDREIVDICRNTNQHPKFEKPFPDGIQYFQIDELESAIAGCDLLNELPLSSRRQQIDLRTVYLDGFEFLLTGY